MQSANVPCGHNPSYFCTLLNHNDIWFKDKRYVLQTQENTIARKWEKNEVYTVLLLYRNVCAFAHIEILKNKLPLMKSNWKNG